ncbi:MAG TPA: hypothetical protein VJ850_10415 [Candidatus Limnocylindrales bacterium]|nr:hypothetical protein [Candidatus Limnocylindrales bacterium]
MIKRLSAFLFAGVIFAACGNGTPTTTSQPTTVPAATGATTTPAAASQGTGEVDPNSIAGFCQAMTDTIVANMPPKDSAAAGQISPLFRNWAQVPAFASISTELLAVADWTASASIMNPVPAPPADVLTAWANITGFQGSNCS